MGASMIVDWIYNNPTWLWGPIVVAIFIAAACGGLLIFHRLVHVKVRRAHNDLAGFTFAIVGVLYAVLLAFIAIATWESFSRASDIVENESDYAGGMYLDTAGLPDAKGQEIRDALAKYVSVVIEVEWPIQRTGKTPDQGWKPLRDLATAIATIHPQNSGRGCDRSRDAQDLEPAVQRSKRAAVGGAGAYSGRHLGDRVFRRSNHNCVHLFLRLRTFRHAPGDDGHARRNTRVNHRDDHRTRLAIPRRDKRLARPVHHDAAIVGRGADSKEGRILR